MKREIRFSEKLLLIGYGIILLFMFVQDWIPIGSLNDVEAILEINSFDYVLTTTIINAGQILFIMGGNSYFFREKISHMDKVMVDNSSVMYFCWSATVLVDTLFYWYWCSAKSRTIPTDVWRHSLIFTSNEWYRSEYVSHHLSCYTFYLYCANLLYHTN